MVVLRRALDAVEDGDHIHAIIKGSAVNNDGSSKVGYLAPSVDGQAAAMSEAYTVSEINPESIGYIECHGTGTYLGDPIELSAMTQAFRQQTERTQFCRIGSVKTNIGHLDTAAGVASLIKAALTVRSGQIPPSLNFEKPNPNIDFENSPFIVNTELTSWPKSPHPRRAAVNSLGVGGTNAHVVLQQPPPRPVSPPTAVRQHIFPISARTKKALDQYAGKLAEHLRAHPEQPLADVAHSLLAGRRWFEQRRVVVAQSHEEAAELLAQNDRLRVFTHTATTDKAPVVFAFTGGGSQYPNMARSLYETQPVFRKVLDRGFAWLKTKTDIDYKAIIFPPAGEEKAIVERMGQTATQLPLIFLVEVGLAELWQSWGVKPEAFVGHSLGENTAACVAGVLSFEDALGLVLLRGQLIETTEEARMVSVQLPRARIEPLLEGKLDLATVNAPDLCVVSGTMAAVEWLEEKLTQMDVDFRRLKIKAASHTRTLDPILADFRAYLASVKLSPPKTPIVSNRTGQWLTDEQATSPDYWTEHLRNTILFADCVQTLMAKPERVIVEIGPGRTLSSLVRGHPSTKPTTNVITSLPHPSEDTPADVHMMTALGRLWASGADIDISTRYGDEARQRVELPTYAWQHQPYWIDAGPAEVPQEDLRHLERLEDPQDWWYRPYWSQQALDDGDAIGSQTWLIFLDEAGVGAKLAERLRGRGDRVVVVHAGDAYHRKSADEYTMVPERGREEYDALIQDLVSSGRTPSRIVHMWLVTQTESFRMGSSFFHRNQEQGFYSLLFLAQSITDENLPKPIQMTVVTNDMLRVGDEALRYPEKSTALGPVRVIPRELEGVTCSCIDVELPATKGLLELLPLPKLGLTNGQSNGAAYKPSSADDVAEQLEHEVMQATSNATVAYRNGQRFIQKYVRRRPKAKPDAQLALKPKGVYMITGGLGGIGLTFAEHLAQKYQARLILLGRTELPERSGWDVWIKLHGEEERTSRKLLKVKALEAAGAEVLVGAADVTDIEAMRALIEEAQQKFGRIEGVFHSAGVTNDELIQMKRQATVEDTFAPKIHGTILLDRILSETPPDFMVLFSSTSTAIAPPGQVDYVAANAFLNAFAQSKAGDENTYVVAMNWGIWNEVGLAAETIRSMVGEVTEGEPRPATHPLFDYKINDGSDDRILRKTYDVSKMWVLNEHRTKGGIALLPGTGYLELVRAALAEFGETGPFEIRDLFFLRPLRVDDGTTKTVEIRLKPTTEGYDLLVRSEFEREDRSGWEQHGQARLLMKRLLPVVPIEPGKIAERCGPGRTPAETDGLQSKQEKHLRFGPRWRVLRRASFGDGEALAELSVPSTFADDLDIWKIHPALLDIATGFAMDLIDGYTGEELWVPVSYRSIKVHGVLPAQVRSWVRNRAENTQVSGVAAFDITITDPEGNVLVEIEDFSIKRLDGDPEAILAIEPTASELQRKTEARDEGQLSPAEQQLRRNMEQGIRPTEGVAALERVLYGDLGSEMVLSSLDLDQLQRQSAQAFDQAGGSDTKFARPELDSEYVEPRDEVERTLVSYWEDLLGVDRVGVKDSFFDLGGHSLIAVRLFAQVRKAFQVDYAISVLFEAPTVEAFAALIKEQIGDVGQDSGEGEQAEAKASASSRTRYMHLVPMNQDESSDKTPFFLVAGMFGNVLNLRNLAGLVGRDRPFYGLQARGLFGDQEPHETFEEAAQDYITEIRTVQPHGPYLLGGFSGGGITAYEIAQQLLADGEEIALLVMLDTILPVQPELSSTDRAKIQMIEIQNKGPQYFAEWADRRMRWEMAKLRKRLAGEEEDEATTPQFQNDAIEAAFRAALPRYVVKHYPGRVVLFRPKLDKRWVLGPDRFVNSERMFVYEDNGWGQHVDQMDVFEVPGDHDSMVLEPNVRILANRLRRFLDESEEDFRQREVRRALEQRSSPETTMQ
ncbi:MAG: SDR family NAD(P)-dependent oxidoreductase [Myxococcota bacterium]